MSKFGEIRFKDQAERESSEIPVGRLIRVGEVTGVDISKLTARVTFDDDGGFVTHELPIMQRNTLSNKDYHVPDIGEDCICLFLPGGTEDGFVLGSFYAGDVTPPESSRDTREVKFADGTIVKYDRASSSMAVTAMGDVTVSARGKVTVISSDDVTLQSAGNVTIAAGGAVRITGTSVSLGE